MVKEVIGLPLSLYSYWVILIVIIILLLNSFLYRKRHSNEYFEDKPRKKFFFCMLLILLGFGLYFIEQLPSFFGYFDFKDMKLVHGYEENTSFGFIRFVYKVAVGVGLLIYGLLGMHGAHEDKH